ncbi:MAG: PEGA domain-containing protein [bacterium]|nr:PEGA domain-containing protein [bacterium]
MNFMYQRFLISILTFLLIIGVSAVTILYARGYKLSPRDGIVKTGLLVVSSKPDGAVVELDGRITDATNTTISYLQPKQYRVRLVREGYLPWEKTVDVKPELVTEIDAVLFPLSPSLKPLTVTGAIRPLLSPNGTKIVYGVPEGRNAGLWMVDLRPNPFRQNVPIQIAADTIVRKFSAGAYAWSPQGDKVLVVVQDALAGKNSTSTFLLPTDRFNEQLLDVTPTIEATVAEWEEDSRLRAERRNAQLADEVRQVLEKAATSAASPSLISRVRSLDERNHAILWSPNETRVLFSLPGDPIPRVYDIKKRKEYVLPDLKDVFAGRMESPLFWYPGEEDAAHLVFVEQGKLQVIEFDGGNKTTVFTGQFDPAFVFPSPDSRKLLIVTSLNTAANSTANLYTIDLR